MKRSVSLAWILVVFTLWLVPSVADAQDHPAGTESEEKANTPEHETHKNHTGSFVGASTHLDNNETGATLGIEYARMIAQKWAVAGYLEMVSSSAERDFILIAAAVFYPWRGLGLVAGPGIERAEKDEEHNGEVTTEKEYDLILRFGAGWGWSLTPAASIGPVVFADATSKRWTIVYGIGMTVGF